MAGNAPSKRVLVAKIVGLSAILVTIASCRPATGPGTTPGDAGTGSALTQRVNLTGAGASFPAPLYQNWAITLAQQEPNLQVNYQSIGSGAGIEQFTAGTVDFGASDTAMTDQQMAAVTRGTLLLPMSAGSIVMAYNLQGVDTGLKLTRDAYVGILSGRITRWNDPAIVNANPGVNLPDQQITVVHRSDGSGTTGVLTKHLSEISPEWKDSIGQGNAVEWPRTGNFVGARGNEGVTAQIQNVNGSLGYVEYGFAANNGLSVAALENREGNFVVPTDETAANTLAAVELPDNLRAFITDPEGADSYPIVTYTWQMHFKEQPDATKAIALEKWIEFGLNEGQDAAPALGYVRLPDIVRQKVAAAADVISPDYTITLK
ncbi:MAG TPA: phosphate ABC transporter substrate-binding protein PstS [Leptolyngbyaceae cyanobacterium M65_K2018_010]|nr:phosphate ABC transporter substrate-binding protein PstS [Leptolyngbyaceae cyanobacterium M65_K2018_010]